MLPPIRKIYINPNFNKHDGSSSQTTSARTSSCTSVVINPNLFRQNMPGVSTATSSPSASIHMNPAFMGHHSEMQFHHQPSFATPEYRHTGSTSSSQLNTPTTAKSLTPPMSTLYKDTRKILTKSRTCIIREPAAKSAMPLSSSTKTLSGAAAKPQPIIKLTKRKLVRQKASDPIPAKKPHVEVKHAPPAPTMSWSAKYKLDRTKTVAKATARTKINFDTRYAMRRAGLQKSCFKVVNLDKKLVNINGVLYKVTRNRLERHMEPFLRTVTAPRGVANSKAPSSAPVERLKGGTDSTRKHGRRLLVDGAQYVMDASGFKITRVPTGADDEPSKCPKRPRNGDVPQPRTPRHRRRIDFGGLTYVASTSTYNVFVRTQNHLALAHLTNAKQRSLNFLSRRYSKRNEPCPIYQRLGKCTGYDNGTCTKLHDQDLVTICPSFLRGECSSRNCLLSHDVSLSKMPVCRFYLQGNCVHNNCPFLHKKLSRKADLCEDFQRGFCKLADKCNKRHEFVCPNIDRTGVCNTPKCAFCMRAKRWRAKQKAKEAPTKPLEAEADELKKPTNSDPKPERNVRYFRSATAAAISALDKQKEKETASKVSPKKYGRPAEGKRRDKNPNEPSFIPI